MRDRGSLSSEFLRALTLHERAALLRTSKQAVARQSSNPDTALYRVASWREQPRFSDEKLFMQRLRIDGVNPDFFQKLLTISAESFANCAAEHELWLNELAKILDVCPEADTDTKEAGLLRLVSPFIRHGQRRLQKEYAEISARPGSPTIKFSLVEASLLADLRPRLLKMIGRTLALELHVARLRDRLEGESPQERYESFVALLSCPKYSLEIFIEYPVLARRVLECVNQWTRFALEVLESLCTDWPVLASEFSLDAQNDIVVALEPGAGDRHSGGRSVVMVRLSSGKRCVYKPRPLSIETHFQQLIRWMNELGLSPELPTLKILDRGDHGWVEFVQASPCDSEGQLCRFYERQGAYLAILYVLDAVDFHAANLVASSENPILIDLETLFHPLPWFGSNPPGEKVPPQEMGGHSVLRLGFLPKHRWSQNDRLGVDLSGLGALPGQKTPFDMLKWQDFGTDAFRFVREPGQIQAKLNRPQLRDHDIDPINYVEQLETGFAAAYRLITLHRKELLSNDGILAAFATAPIRVILRDTQIYSLLLEESYHPDMLRDGLARSRFFDWLWNEVERRPHLLTIIRAEIEELHSGDVPLFRTRPDSRHLCTSRGTDVEDFLPETGWSRVQRRLRSLNDQDLARQCWLIRASMATLAKSPKLITKGSIPVETPLGKPPSRASILRAADTCAKRLSTLAHGKDEDLGWLSLAPDANGQWDLAPMGFELYDGLSGICLFLAYLGKVGGVPAHESTARQLAGQISRRLEAGDLEMTNIGAFAGWGGLIYTFTHLGSLWNAPELFGKADQIIDMLPPLIEADQKLDVIAGSAGCLVSLLCRYTAAPSEKILHIAELCGDRLISTACRTKSGLGWLTQADSSRVLAGFSHGIAGIAWALLELFQATGKERFRETAMAALVYERSLFCKEQGNWPDLREYDEHEAGDPHTSFPVAWCHGAVGIGLARLRSKRSVHDDEINHELAVALETTLKHGFGGNHSLCHGDMGNLELLIQGKELMHRPDIEEAINRVTTQIMYELDRGNRICATPLRVETPGLMTGISGIGYGLLRLAEPHLVPSILTLDPPSENVRSQ